MARDKTINIIVFDEEIGKLGYDIDQGKSFFQYNPDFLTSGKYDMLFPFIFKRIEQTQVFKTYQSDTFRGLPPMIADSLPDTFGNIIFQEWLTSKGIKNITPLEQLTYVANRGMGALEYKPETKLPDSTQINLDDVISVLQKVLDLKASTKEKDMSELSLLNIFKIGTSAGGVSPKILVSEHKETGQIIAGDKEVSDNYNHYIIKLHLNDNDVYNREKVEYAYYLLAQEAGINMMPSKMLENKHFATLRFDRQNGEKQHVLTATGLTGWDFKNNPETSSYENLFKLCLSLSVPHKNLQQLFRRMVFNVVFCNVDDHLKNHSFIYDKENNRWNLSPAYDLTFALNPLLTFKSTSRALSVNGKRTEITTKDLFTMAETYAIKNPKGIISEIETLKAKWMEIAQQLDIPKTIIEKIYAQFIVLA